MHGLETDRWVQYSDSIQLTSRLDIFVAYLESHDIKQSKKEICFISYVVPQASIQYRLRKNTFGSHVRLWEFDESNIGASKWVKTNIRAKVTARATNNKQLAWT